MKQRLNLFGAFFVNNKIIIALLLAATIALISAAVSVWMYNVSDVARIDISRPGYEQARESVIKDSENITFGATGVLDSDAMKDFQKLFDEKHAKLDAMGKFDGDALSDEQLNMIAE